MLIQLLVVSVVFIFCIGCDIKEIAPESGIVAHVGEHAITAHEFKLYYEFGFAHLKNSPDKKFSYLEYMIKQEITQQNKDIAKSLRRTYDKIILITSQNLVEEKLLNFLS